MFADPDLAVRRRNEERLRATVLRYVRFPDGFDWNTVDKSWPSLIWHSKVLLDTSTGDWADSQIIFHCFVNGVQIRTREEANRDLRGSVSYLLFHTRATVPTATKWMSEWDASCWWSTGFEISSVLPRAWLAEWPRRSDDDDEEFPLVPNVRDLMDDARDEEVKVRVRRCTQFIGRRGTRARLYNIARSGKPCADLALQILKADTACESQEWMGIAPSVHWVQQRGVLTRHQRRRRPKKKLVRPSSLVKQSSRKRRFPLVHRRVRGKTPAGVVPGRPSNHGFEQLGGGKKSSQPVILRLACGSLIEDTIMAVRKTLEHAAETCELWQPIAQQRASCNIVPPKAGTLAELRGFSLSQAGGLWIRFHWFYKKSVDRQALWLATDNMDKVNEVSESIPQKHDCCLLKHGFRRAKSMAKSSPLGAELLRSDSFRSGLRTAVHHCGPTASTVLEEQLHALCNAAFDRRLGCGRDVGNTCASVFIDQLMRTHGMSREDLLAMRNELYAESAKCMQNVLETLSTDRNRVSSRQRGPATVESLRKHGHILYANKRIQAVLDDGVRALEAQKKHDFQTYVAEWKLMSEEDRLVALQEFVAEADEARVLSDSDADSDVVALDNRLTRAAGDGDTLWSMGDDKYPLSPELYFKEYLEPELTAEKARQYAEHGRCKRIGAERDCIDRCRSQENSVGFDGLIPNDPLRFDQDAMSKKLDLNRTCCDKHPGLCETQHKGIFQEVMDFVTSLGRFVATFKLHLAPEGTVMLLLRGSAVLSSWGSFQDI